MREERRETGAEQPFRKGCERNDGKRVPGSPSEGRDVRRDDEEGVWEKKMPGTFFDQEKCRNIHGDGKRVRGGPFRKAGMEGRV
jgi:hypothetical protein